MQSHWDRLNKFYDEHSQATKVNTEAVDKATQSTQNFGATLDAISGGRGAGGSWGSGGGVDANAIMRHRRSG